MHAAGAPRRGRHEREVFLMMLDGCIHPQIMQALSLCGHGDKILIADGNYPLQSRTGDAKKVFLGLTAGVPTVTQVLEALQKEIVIEDATVMQPTEGGEPEIFAEFTQMLGGAPLRKMERYAFYERCCEPDVRLAISTGEKRTFANILITVGVA